MAAVRRNKLIETVWAIHRECDQMYRRFEQVDKGYRAYLERTQRHLAVVLLEPVSPTVTE
jgi:hypothetical protein